MPSVKKRKNLFDDMAEALESAIQWERGKRTRRIKVSSVTISPVRKLSPIEVKNLRINLGMTQALFADVLGVTKKAVEAWEAGAKNPSGPVLRMFEILEKESLVLERVGIFSRKKSA
jgi:putative transcriptional regulator